MKRKILNWILIMGMIIESVILIGAIHSNSVKVKTSDLNDAELIEIAKAVSKARYPDLSCEDKEWGVMTDYRGDKHVFCMPEELSVGGGLPQIVFNKNLGIKEISLQV